MPPGAEEAAAQDETDEELEKLQDRLAVLLSVWEGHHLDGRKAKPKAGSRRPSFIDVEVWAQFDKAAKRQKHNDIAIEQSQIRTRIQELETAKAAKQQQHQQR